MQSGEVPKERTSAGVTKACTRENKNVKTAETEQSRRGRKVRGWQVAVGLMSMLLGAAATANAQTVIWESTLTVETFGNITGYSTTYRLGSLSNATFKYKGRTLTVNAVATSSLEGTTELLLGITDLFTEEPELSNWTLTIDGTDYTEATADPDRNGNQLAWTSLPTWNDGEMVTVKLTTTEPGRPRNVTAEDDDPHGPTVTLTWAAPTSIGASAITNYQYRRGGLEYGSYGEWTSIPGGSSARSAAVKTPYAWPETTYPFQMRAVNSVGAGLWSNIARADVVDEREGLQVSDTSAYGGTRTPQEDGRGTSAIGTC